MLKSGWVLLVVGAVVTSLGGACSGNDSDGDSSFGECVEFKAGACGQCIATHCVAELDAICSNRDVAAWTTCYDACETPSEKCAHACHDDLRDCEAACTDMSCCSDCENSSTSCESKCPPRDGNDSEPCYEACDKSHSTAIASLNAYVDCAFPLTSPGAACETACDTSSMNVCI